MKRMIFLIFSLVIVFANAHSEGQLTVPDVYSLLTEDEIEDGIMLDPETLFAYTLLNDDTIMLVRYTWIQTRVSVPSSINDTPVSEVGAYAFLDTPVQEIELPCGIAIDSDAFSYSDVKAVYITGTKQ